MSAELRTQSVIKYEVDILLRKEQIVNVGVVALDLYNNVFGIHTFS